LAYFAAGRDAPLALVVGAALSGWGGLWAANRLLRRTRLKEDAVFGLVLSLFFGVGVLLLSISRRRGAATGQSGLESLLFGQAATLTEADVRLIVILGLVVLIAVVMLFKEFKLLAFDAAFAESIGFDTRLITVALTALTLIAIVIGLRSVGIVLMASLLVGPAVAARQWTERLGVMCALAGLFGALAGAVGAWISAIGVRLPTGPMVIVCVSTIAALSLLFGSARGMVWTWTRVSRSS
jgi:manganese/zinc/iron transport system permease protein